MLSSENQKRSFGPLQSDDKLFGTQSSIMPILPIVDVDPLDRTRPTFERHNLRRWSISSAAGLQMGVSRVYEDLQQIPLYGTDGKPRGRVHNSGTCVYLAGVLEYLTAEVLELAGNATREAGARTIEPEHIATAFKKDKELLELAVILKGEAGVTSEEMPAAVESDNVKLSDLNADGLQIVLYHVGTVDLVQSCQFVCKRWNELLAPVSDFWKRRFFHLYHLTPRPQLPDDAYLQASTYNRNETLMQRQAFQDGAYSWLNVNHTMDLLYYHELYPDHPSAISKHHFEVVAGNIICDYATDEEMTEEAVDVLQAAAEDHVIRYMRGISRLEEREGKEVDEEILYERDLVRLQRSHRLIDRLMDCHSERSATNDRAKDIMESDADTRHDDDDSAAQRQDQFDDIMEQTKDNLFEYEVDYGASEEENDYDDEQFSPTMMIYGRTYPAENTTTLGWVNHCAMRMNLNHVQGETGQEAYARWEMEHDFDNIVDRAEKEGLTDDEDWVNDTTNQSGEWYLCKWRKYGTCLQYYIDRVEKPDETIDRADYQLWCNDIQEVVPPARWKGLVIPDVAWKTGEMIQIQELIEEMIEEGSSVYLREYWSRSQYDFASKVMGLYHIREEIDAVILGLYRDFPPMLGKRHRVVGEAEEHDPNHSQQLRLHCSWNPPLSQPPASLDIIKSQAAAHIKGLELFRVLQDGWAPQSRTCSLPPVDIFSLFSLASDALTAEEKRVIGQMHPALYDGYNLLHMAVDCMPDDPVRCEETVRRLIEEYGISVTTKTETDGYTAVNLAIENGRGGLVEVLRDYEEESTAEEEIGRQLKKLKVTVQTRRAYTTIDHLPRDIIEYVSCLLLPHSCNGSESPHGRSSPLFRSVFHLVRIISSVINSLSQMLCNQRLYRFIHPIYLKHFLYRMSLPFKFPAQIKRFFVDHPDSASLVHTLHINNTNNLMIESMRVFDNPHVFSSLRRIEGDIRVTADGIASMSSLPLANFERIKIRMDLTDSCVDDLLESYYNCLLRTLIRPHVKHFHLDAYRSGPFFVYNREASFVDKLASHNNLTELYLPSFMQSSLTQHTWPLLQKFGLHYNDRWNSHFNSSTDGYDIALFSAFYDRHPSITDIDLHFTGRLKPTQLPNLTRVRCCPQSLNEVITPLSDGTYRPITHIEFILNSGYYNLPIEISHHLQELPHLSHLSNIDRSFLGVVQLPPSLESLSIIYDPKKWTFLLPYDHFRRSMTLTNVIDGDSWYPLIVWLNQWLNATPTLKYIRLYSNIEVWADPKGILVKVAHQDGDEWMTYDMEEDE
ncbi:histone H2A type 2-B-like [Planoprotostelium fungivorum]|uniref:Histone H2A type 2-B-like n=1 Tax=Planoprotostelium fungivorum TaxID=1890364 RepID=A0A2P6NCV8_9EUKA|nr:histone H2A type 2-B-like [Planoprotostelium fungivorum]